MGIRDGWRMLFILVSLCWKRDAMLRPVCSETDFTAEMIGGHVSIVAANCLSSRVIESSPNSSLLQAVYPPLQFCWPRRLPDLLHIPTWRGSKETAVFAAEL